MNKKRQREISYIKLSKQGTGYSIAAQPIHAESLREHFLKKFVPFVKPSKAVGSENLLQFSAEEDGKYLEKVLEEWKERFVSGGEQYW